MPSAASSPSRAARLETLSSLRVGGLTPLTSIDFPGRLAAVVFCQGCPWRCVYCHNPHLIPPDALTEWDWGKVTAFLSRRRGLLDGVVFSGGEPTLQSALPEAMKEVRAMGFEIALHTAGMYPERLAAVLPLVDWVGLDIKAPAHLHDDIVGTPGGHGRAMASLDLIIASGVDYECRTTWHPSLFDATGLADLASELDHRRAQRWSVQDRRQVGRTEPNAARIVDGLLAHQFPRLAMRAT